MGNFSMHSLKIEACWDDEALVWYVAESDVPGLNAEGDTVEDLIAKIRDLAPYLLEVNDHLLEKDKVDDESPSLCIQAHRLERLALA